jgi:hypothetical protein
LQAVIDPEQIRPEYAAVGQCDTQIPDINVIQYIPGDRFVFDTGCTLQLFIQISLAYFADQISLPVKQNQQTQNSNENKWYND